MKKTTQWRNNTSEPVTKHKNKRRENNSGKGKRNKQDSNNPNNTRTLRRNTKWGQRKQLPSTGKIRAREIYHIQTTEDDAQHPDVPYNQAATKWTGTQIWHQKARSRTTTMEPATGEHRTLHPRMHDRNAGADTQKGNKGNRTQQSETDPYAGSATKQEASMPKNPATKKHAKEKEHIEPISIWWN